jgi:hypothetical protein
MYREPARIADRIRSGEGRVTSAIPHSISVVGGANRTNGASA